MLCLLEYRIRVDLAFWAGTSNKNNDETIESVFKEGRRVREVTSERCHHHVT